MKKKVVLWIFAILFLLSIIVTFSLDVSFNASSTDMLLYRAATCSIFIIVEIGILVELDLFHIKSKIPLAKERNVGKHILFWLILFFAAGIFFIAIYSFTSEEFKVALNEEQSHQKRTGNFRENEYIESNTINAEFLSEQASDTGISEIETQGEIETVPAEKQQDVPEMSQTENEAREDKSAELNTTTEMSDEAQPKEETEPELVGKEPVSITFDDEYIVGNVTVHVNEIQIRQIPFKVGSKMVQFRIFLDIVNDTSSEQFFRATKTGNIVGVYHDSDESYIDGMDNLAWDKEDYAVMTSTMVPPNDHKEIVVQAGAITTEPVYYGDEIKFDIFFRNGDTEFTVYFTCNL